MRRADATLALPPDTVTRNYQEAQTTIDLSFTTGGITNRLIYCEIDEKVENLLDYLSIRTVLDLRPWKKSTCRLRRNWKAMDKEKFDNILRELLPESLSSNTIERDSINEYTSTLIRVLEEAIEESTSWTRPHERAKLEWTQECTDVIKKTRRLRRQCCTSRDWEEYVRACDRKGKILKRHKRDEFRS